jgi:hypothetical protein
MGCMTAEFQLQMERQIRTQFEKGTHLQQAAASWHLLFLHGGDDIRRI